MEQLRKKISKGEVSAQRLLKYQHIFRASPTKMLARYNLRGQEGTELVSVPFTLCP